MEEEEEGVEDVEEVVEEALCRQKSVDWRSFLRIRTLMRSLDCQSYSLTRLPLCVCVCVWVCVCV